MAPDYGTPPFGPFAPTSLPQTHPVVREQSFSEEELDVYRKKCLYVTTQPWLEGCHPALMRYLWKAKGFTFSSDALMWAALASEVPPNKDSTGRHSQFRQSLMKSLAETLSEDHLQYASREIDHHQLRTTTEGYNFYDFSTTTGLIIMGFWDRRDRCPFFTIMN